MIEGRRFAMAGLLGGLLVALPGCPCEKPHAAAYEPEPAAIAVGGQGPTPDQIGGDSPTVTGTITAGQGGGVLIDVVIENKEPTVKIESLYVYSGSYELDLSTGTPKVPTKEEPPEGSTWVATQELSRTQGSSGHREPYSFLGEKDLYAAGNPNVWVFLSLYFGVEDSNGFWLRRRQYYVFTRSDKQAEVPDPGKYYEIDPGGVHSFSKEGSPHGW